MKRLVVLLLVVLVLSVTGVCFAEAELPNLVGTWEVKSEAALLVKGGETGAWTHHSEEFSRLSAEMTVTKQQGRILYGTFSSARATEQFAAVIGWDNKTLYYVDNDGFFDGVIVDKDKIKVIYRHVGDKDSVVAAGIMTRKK